MSAFGCVVSLSVDQGRAEQHKRYWRKHGLQQFWRGTAFHQADLGQELAYELVEILVRNLLTDYQDGFMDFVQRADVGNAGDKASQYCLGVSLAARVAAFLGKGPWKPNQEEVP